MADGGTDPPPDGFERSGEEDPYDGEDLAEYPDWWRRNVEEYRAYGLRPYRPPRFEDGVLVSPTLDDLEDELGVEVRLRVLNPERGREWRIEVDEEPIDTVEKRRLTEGYSEYGTTAEAFESTVRRAVEEDD